MSIEELQTRIEELQKELEPYRKYKNRFIVQHCSRERIEMYAQNKLTDEQKKQLQKQVQQVGNYQDTV